MLWYVLGFGYKLVENATMNLFMLTRQIDDTSTNYRQNYKINDLSLKKKKKKARTHGGICALTCMGLNF